MGLVSAVITRAQDRFPDMDSTRALVLFNDAYKEILTRCQLRNKTVSLSLTAGTREYDWDETDFRVWEAIYYADSSDQGTPIEPTSTDELDIFNPGWRGLTTRGKPRLVYFTTADDSNTSEGKVGFHDIPDTTTSASYPHVKFYCTSYTALVTGDATPPSLLSDQVLIDRICYLWAKDMHHEDVQFWDGMSEREIERNIQHVKNILRRKNDRVVRTWMYGRRVV